MVRLRQLGLVVSRFQLGLDAENLEAENMDRVLAQVRKRDLAFDRPAIVFVHPNASDFRINPAKETRSKRDL